MTQVDLFKAIEVDTKVSRATVRKVVQSCFSAIEKAVATGERVRTPMGQFAAKMVSARQRYDPVKKENYIVPEHYAPMFIPTAAFTNMTKESLK